MNFFASIVAALFVATAAHAADNAKILYDRTVDDVRVDVSDDQLKCSPGYGGLYPTTSALTVSSYWLQIADVEFSKLELSGSLIYADTRFGDHCADLKATFAGQENAVGKARRTVTEYFGLRYATCWHWLTEKITLDLNGLRFAGGDQRINVGPAAAELCK